MKIRNSWSLSVRSIFVAFFFLSYASCAHLTESQKKEYGLLESAVTYSSEIVIGEYDISIPHDFDAEKFMVLVKGKIPGDYYHALEKYSKQVESKGSYYLIVIFASKTNTVILFDYSCTPEVDGPVLLEPEKYDPLKMDSYDKCKN